MVQDIFDVSKAASGNIDLEWSTLDLTKLIRQTLADMEENIIDSGLIFRVKLPPDPVFIRTDGNRMYRVFQNLIKNALQYSLEGSRVFVQVRLENDLAVTEIKNTSRYESILTATRSQSGLCAAMLRAPRKAPVWDFPSPKPSPMPVAASFHHHRRGPVLRKARIPAVKSKP